MSSIKWFNYLLFMENLLGIYRNYCNQKKIKKCFIILQIFIQTLLHTILIIGQMNLLAVDYNNSRLIFVWYITSTYMNSVSSIVTGICYSRAFMSYIKSFSRVFEWFKDDKKLIISLKKMFCFGISFNLTYVVFAVIRTTEIVLRLAQSGPSIIFVIILASQIRITMVFQHLMLYIVIMIVVNLCKSSTSLISAVQESARRCDISSDEECYITREQIQRWVELYRDLANCCEKLSLCFGRQFFFSIILSISHYILMTYSVLSANAVNMGDIQEYMRIAMTLFSYVSVTIMPLAAGQMASNQGLKFNRVLVRLYNTMIIGSNEAEAKWIKDFIRLVKRNPLEIKLMSKLPAGIYMLPVILTLTVNYLIFMLQFNHIL